MCYSLESSRNSFLVGGTASLYLLFISKDNTNRHIGLFFFVVSLMQLLEYFMWKDQKCGLMNDIASRFAQPLLILQILSIFVGAYIFNTTTVSKNILSFFILGISIYFFYGIYVTFFGNNLKWCTKPNSDNSLQWANHGKLILKSDITRLFYLAVFLLTPFFIKKKLKALIVLIIGVLSYYMTRTENHGTWNSRWCYYTAYLPPLFIIFDNFKL